MIPLATIDLALTALGKTMEFLSTPAGQSLITQSIADRAKWDAFWDKTGTDLKGFFGGIKLT